MATRAIPYKDVRAYKSSFRLQQKIFEVTKAFPKEEACSLCDQLRRSSRSIGANLAEAWQERKYPALFLGKVTDSDAELAETRHWIATAFACGYLTKKANEALLDECRLVGSLLGAMLERPEKFLLYGDVE